MQPKIDAAVVRLKSEGATAGASDEAPVRNCRQTRCRPNELGAYAGPFMQTDWLKPLFVRASGRWFPLIFQQTIGRPVSHLSTKCGCLASGPPLLEARPKLRAVRASSRVSDLTGTVAVSSIFRRKLT